MLLKIKKKKKKSQELPARPFVLKRYRPSAFTKKPTLLCKIDYSGWTDLIDAGIFINSGLVWQANSDGKRTKFAYMMMCVIPIS